MRLRSFLRRHALWAGSLAVIIPLAIILRLQYVSLATLERTLPAARKERMESYLATVVTAVEDAYLKTVDDGLDLNAEEFSRQPISSMQAIEPHLRVRLSRIAEHFKTKNIAAAKKLFVAQDLSYGERAVVAVFFYNPQSQSMELDPGTPEWRAAHAACASWMAHNWTDTQVTNPRPAVDERDPDNRVIVKPIVDSSAKVVGVAGMILDSSHLTQQILPGALREFLPAYFPSDGANAVVTIRDLSNSIQLTNGPPEAGEDVVRTPLRFVFTDWRLGIRMRGISEEQLAKRFFHLNLSLTALMSAVLIGGVVLALRAAAREMKLSQMKADFVSNVSHELRTPLSSIRVFGEFMKLGRVDDGAKIREYGRFIEAESRRLTQLINNILDFSRIESGRKEYRLERTAIDSLILETLRAFRARLAQSGIEIDFETDERPLPPVLVDPAALAQAFVNLLDNAIKYSGTARKITVRLGQRDGYATVSVTDCGIGIAAEQLPKIFDKFYRVGTGFVHDVKGSGLGLAIVKHIVESHGGRVTVESRLGFGSTFTIFLPLSEDGSEPDARSSEIADSHSRAAHSENGAAR